MELKVATKNERLEFERILKNDSIKTKNRDNQQKIPIKKSQLNNNNENNINIKVNERSNYSSNGANNQNYIPKKNNNTTKTKRDIYWEQKRDRKLRQNNITNNVEQISYNQNLRGRTMDISNNYKNNNQHQINNINNLYSKRGSSVPYNSENNLIYNNRNNQIPSYQSENTKMNTTDYNRTNSSRFQYESNRFNNTTNVPSNQQFFEGKNSDYKINNNRPNFSGIKLNENNIQMNNTNNIFNNNNNVLQPLNNHNKNRFNPQYSKY